MMASIQRKPASLKPACALILSSSAAMGNCTRSCSVKSFSRRLASPHALPFVLTVVALVAIGVAHVFPDDAIAMAYSLTAVAVVASLGLILAPAVERIDRPR